MTSRSLGARPLHFTSSACQGYAQLCAARPLDLEFAGQTSSNICSGAEVRRSRAGPYHAARGLVLDRIGESPWSLRDEARQQRPSNRGIGEGRVESQEQASNRDLAVHQDPREFQSVGTARHADQKPPRWAEASQTAAMAMLGRAVGQAMTTATQEQLDRLCAFARGDAVLVSPIPSPTSSRWAIARRGPIASCCVPPSVSRPRPPDYRWRAR